LPPVSKNVANIVAKIQTTLRSKCLRIGGKVGGINLRVGR